MSSDTKMYLIIFVCFYIFGNADAQSRFTYENQELWPRNFSQCGGQNQSPINIYFDDTIPVFIPPFKFYGFSRPIPVPMIFQIKDGSVDISLHSQNDRLTPYVRNKYLKDSYVFDSFHFHWGSNDNVGSEHIVNGRQYPLELHLVHRKATYPTLAEAINFEDGLLVFGVFYEISASDNQDLAPIVDMILSRNSTNFLSSPVSLKRLMGNIDPNRYYTYFGSFTVPPCFEAVTWIVYPQPSKISHRQLEVFRSAIGPDRQRSRINYRFTQPLNGRPVYRNLGYPYFF